MNKTTGSNYVYVDWKDLYKTELEAFKAEAIQQERVRKWAEEKAYFIETDGDLEVIFKDDLLAYLSDKTK
jgi:hypothetical protein